MQRHTSRRAAVLASTSVLALTGSVLVAAAQPAVAAPLMGAAVPATGAYSADAAADLVHLNAVNIPGAVDVLDASVAPVTTKVSTATTPRVTSHATNATLNLLGTGGNNLLVDALQTAPPDHTTGVHAELLSVPAAPLLTASVATADAHSRFKADDTCLTTGQLSNAISKVADLKLLPASPLGGDLLSLANGNDPSGAVVSETTAGLVKQPASAANYAVRTTSSTQVTSVNVLGQLVVDVITAPKVVATATGVPGTSTVALTQPVLRINGQTLIAGETLSPIAIPGGPVIELTVGTLTKTIAADGTSASGSGNLLSLKVLDVTGTITLADVSLGDVSAKATAPAGGVKCNPLTPDPLRDARKDLSAATANPGATFDYTVTVPNRGNADLTDVKVVDTVSGSPALTLVKAVPAPASSSGSTYTFSLGTIKPNEVKTIVLTLKVPSNAPAGAEYSNKAVITATYGGQTVSKTVTVAGPTVDAAGPSGCDLSRSTKFASHREVFKGENFTYYVNVFNQGGTACSGVVVKDALVSGVAFVSCTHSCTHSGQLVTWKVGTVGPGASVQLAVTVKTLASSGTLPNAADVTPASGIGGTPSTGGPTVTGASVLAPGLPATRGSNGALARTGGSPVLPLGALLVMAAAYGLRRRAIA
jgi:uncharacterized repeat protein (TIGR01451 family)